MDSIFDKFNDDEEQMKFGEDMRKYELFAVVAYIVPILFFIPCAADKESDFCKFHSNQALCWLIVMFILETLSGIMIAVNLDPIGMLMNLVSMAGVVFLAVGAYKGYAIKIPVLGDIIKPFK